MPSAPSTEKILDAFQISLARDLPQEILAQVSVEKPAEVVTADGQPSHWHVPVRVGKRTVGFMDFTLDGTLVRHGNRLQQSSDIDNQSPDQMDMNVTDMVATARNAVSQGATVENAPTLIADQSPMRLAWMLNGREADGKAFRVFVTPKFSWSEPAKAKPADRE
jgi:hypothetical protein